ncbi:MAG: methyltransferase domain-containing protein [Candidatus Alkanophagales archaeon]
MRLAFELSGEYETLPRAETLACLDMSGTSYEEVVFKRGVLLIVEVRPSEPPEALLEFLGERLAMTHRILRVFALCEPSEDAMLRALADAEDEIRDFLGGGAGRRSFAVRVRKRGLLPVKIDSMALERRLGAEIKRWGFDVRLENPNRTICVLVTKDICVLGGVLRSIDKKQFLRRAPQARPFFMPGVLLPKFARALVNLSRVRGGERLLDPFCGTGGILIEAALVGAEVFGCDILRRAVRGAAENLSFYGLKGELAACDATALCLRDESIDAIATDPPYGRSTPLRRPLEKLYEDAVSEMHRVLKKNRFVVLLSSFRDVPHDGFELLETHECYVHKSLTRYVNVLRKT